MRNRLPWSAVPVEDWPAVDRARWRDIEKHWGEDRRKCAARAYGQLLAFCRDAGIAGESHSVDAFAAQCTARLTPYSAHSTLKHLAYALLGLHPAATWTWLIETYRRVLRRARGTPGPNTASRPRGTATVRIPFRDWPVDYRERWERGLERPVQAQRPEEIYARFKLRGRNTGSNRSPTRDGSIPARMRRTAPRHPSTWSLSTQRLAQAGWGGWLHWCATHDSRTNAESISRERLARYIDFHIGRDCALTSIATYVRWMLLAVRVLFPDRDWRWLVAECELLDEMSKPVVDKLAKLIPIEELVRLGESLMNKADRQPLSIRAALLHRDGLLIATLAWRPKRIGNMGRVLISENMTFDNAGDIVALRFDRTKNGRPTATSIPKWLKARYRRYLAYYRTIMDLRGSDALWLSEHGNALSLSRISRMLRTRTKAAFGIAIGPHAFRHAYATSMGTADPTSLEATQAMFDHRDPHSIRSYEPVARSSYASRRLEDESNKLLIKPPIREESRRRKPKSPVAARVPSESRTGTSPDPEGRAG